MIETLLTRRGFLSRTAAGTATLAIALVTAVARFSLAAAAPLPDRGLLALHSLGANAEWHVHGVLGDRLAANVDQWLHRAPSANPGMLDMFRVRDRQPVPQLVPWAGEFAGKYLLSAVQALQLTRDPALREYVTRFVASLLATQADDGYLGPFPEADRLRGNWDLWGHYHVMQGLLLYSGNECLAADFAQFELRVQALDAKAIAALARK